MQIVRVVIDCGIRRSAVRASIGLVGALSVIALGEAVGIPAMISLVVGATLAALAMIVVRRPQPATILLLLPVSYLLPILATVSYEGRSAKLTAADVVIALGAFAWILRRVPAPLYWIAMNATLVFMAGLSLFVSGDVGLSLTGFKVVLEAALVAAIASTAARSVFVHFAWSAGLMSVGLTLQLGLQGAFGVMVGDSGGGNLEGGIDLLHNSATALTLPVGRSNYVAALILLGILGLVSGWRILGGRFERRVAAVLISIAAFGVAVTASRSQLIGLAFVLAIAFVRVPRRERALVVGRANVWILRVVVTCLVIMAGWILYRYIGATFGPVVRAGTGYSSLSARYSIWSAAVSTIRDHPLLGVGVFGLALQTPQGTFETAHDFVLQVGAETGLFGVFLYLTALTAPMFRNRAPYRNVAIVLVLGLMVAGVAEPTLRTGLYDYVAWAFLGLLIASGPVSANAIGENQRVSAGPASVGPDCVDDDGQAM